MIELEQQRCESELKIALSPNYTDHHSKFNLWLQWFDEIVIWKISTIWFNLAKLIRVANTLLTLCHEQGKRNFEISYSTPIIIFPL